MNRNILVSILVTAIVGGGLLLLFPVEWVALLVVLVALITGQVILLRRHLTVIPSPNRRTRPSMGRVAFRSGAAAISPATAEAAQSTAGEIATEPPMAEATPAVETADPLDKELYSRFRAHLEAMEQSADRARPAASPSPPAANEPQPQADALLEAAAEDRVEISVTARASRSEPLPRIAPPRSAPLRKPLPEANEEDLFADLRPEPDRIAEGKTAERAPRSAPAQAKRKPPPHPDEVQAALERARSPENLRQEGVTLLKLAEDAHAAGELDRLAAALEQYDDLLEEAPHLRDWRAGWLRARLAVRRGNLDDVPERFEEALARGALPPEPEVPAFVERTVAELSGERADLLRVALYHKILSVHRQGGRREAIDRIYGLIEEAQERTGDERKLIQVYKNHLTIREVLGDRDGQLELIDKIGNRYFKLDDTAPAREYYEMGLKLRAELDAAREVAAEAEGRGTAKGVSPEPVAPGGKEDESMASDAQSSAEEPPSNGGTKSA